MFAEENRKRKAKGLPHKVLRDTRAMVRLYVPNAKPPRSDRASTFHRYSASHSGAGE
jgi:hypothetical protein